MELLGGGGNTLALNFLFWGEGRLPTLPPPHFLRLWASGPPSYFPHSIYKYKTWRKEALS